MSYLPSVCHLLPGRNVSRSCSEDGWSQLEPSSYYIACGMEDSASSVDEVREPWASVHPEVHLPQARIPKALVPGSPNREHTQDFHRIMGGGRGRLSSEQSWFASLYL